MSFPYTFDAYLDWDERHPRLFGDCILPRDDDGMGFGLAIPKDMRGRYVTITIEAKDTDREGNPIPKVEFR